MYMYFLNELNRLISRGSISQEVIAASMDINRSRVSRELNGKREMSRGNLEGYLKVARASPDEAEYMREQYEHYMYLYRLTEDKRDIFENKIPEVFRKLTNLSYAATFPFQECPQVKDGFYSSQNDCYSVIQAELMRELKYSEGRIDVFVPSKYSIYYNNIENILRTNTETELKIRQLVLIPIQKRTFNSENEMLNFLPELSALTFLRPNCYDSYYFDLDYSLEQLCGIGYPYYICTSTCLIRISCDTQSILVSHSDVEIQAYRHEFEKSLSQNKVTRLFVHSSIIDMVGNMADYIFNYGYAPFGCVAFFCSNETIRQLINPDILATVNIPEMINQIKTVSDSLKKDISFYFSETGLSKFCSTGIIPEYPRSFTKIATVQQRINILEELISQISSDTYSCRILRETENLPLPSDYIIGGNESGVGLYRDSPMTTEEYEILTIRDSNVINSFKMFFTEYLPHTNLICSKEETIKTIRKHIDRLKNSAE